MLRYERYFKRFLHKLARVPDVHCWAAGYDLYDLEFAPSMWQVQHFTRPIRFPKFVEMELADFHPGIFKPYSQRGQHDTTPGPPVQWFLLPKHDRRFVGDCDSCSELVVRYLECLLAGASENTTTSLTSITSTTRDTTSMRLRYRDVLIVKVGYDHINLEKVLRNASIPVQDMRRITEDMVTSNRDEVWIVSTEDLQGLERKAVVIVGETQPDKYSGVFHCTSQLVFISYTGLPEPWPIVKGRRKTDTDWKYAERHFVPEKKPVSHINIYQTAKV
ncbi:hypothetical protein C0Q70_03559 [Pomacea canaliculata]|uniref:Uncharacterized protein n=1 Tax=Pomacea canaliculata TaxID=400727 RepID=A0A2T7PT32_POMCA|nr:hypothetical protein C0Q70_03559 [Pomacea canaliculata]